MSRILQFLFGRLPIGWLQLSHNRGRFIGALTGVAFANLLIFVQLGIMNAVAGATLKPYEFFTADIMISAEDANALNEGSNVARQWMLMALSDPQVTDGIGLLVANLPWERDTGSISLTTFGIDPGMTTLLSPDIASRVDLLRLKDAVLLDRRARSIGRDEAAGIRPQTPLRFESDGRSLSIQDTFSGGGGFGGDGYLFTSDQTFLSLFPARQSGAPDHILLRVHPFANVAQVIDRLQNLIPDKTLRIRSYAEAQAQDLTYQQRQKPTGVIFGFGVLIGVMVGLVIVYQVLSSDVADHISEYATFKAMGYGPAFFMSIILEEALVLGLLGFIPGVMAGTGLLALMAKVTSLPLTMTVSMAVTVFVGTVVFSVASGMVATRRVIAADPANLF
ncbi:FtsX-like permease family protein [Halocynthiibacter styelae]|uniref:FtsX-like permease family protein n=1 Tax=Halocynthiibacter styelae TaxID=2761955 RepID=A0A8J7IMC4_9RHOB|nr:FtsX-like permease family protein [Paenihalocynthiibacter styelae]MBI1493216.1 FtsX-like permease family protein [Paenihalocynthiibacter styelae]